jgi:molybdopterin-guanine dinucleotide biosynthesis protein A
LCALYRRQILPTVEDALRAGRYKIELLFGEVPTRFVIEQEIESAGFDCEMFRNVNTPEDYQRVRAHSSNVRTGHP